MTTGPYASADRVSWIIDNGSSHRGAAAAERMASNWPTAQLIHLSAQASWLDQAEICFFVIERKVLTPDDFTGLDQIRGRLAAFEARYDQIAWPFTFTTGHAWLAMVAAGLGILLGALFGSLRALTAAHYDLIARGGGAEQACAMLTQAGLPPWTPGNFGPDDPWSFSFGPVAGRTGDEGTC